MTKSNDKLRRSWTEAEITVLTEAYGEKPIETLLQLLPERSEKSIRLKAFKLGLSPPISTWTELEDQFLCTNYQEMTAKELSALLPGRTVKAVQKRISLLRLSGEQWACNYSVDADFFATPNVLNSYWAGFIAADGCVATSKRNSSKSLQITVTKADGYLLERFAADTKFTGKVRISTVKEGFKVFKEGQKAYYAKPSALISVACCQQWFIDLERHFNIVPRKSLILKAPNNLDRQCSLAYIKGYIDGDGCIHQRKDCYLTIVFYGAAGCLSWIKSICDEIAPHYSDAKILDRGTPRNSASVLQKGTIFIYTLSGYRAEVLGAELLQLPLPGLARKWDKIDLLHE